MEVELTYTHDPNFANTCKYTLFHERELQIPDEPVLGFKIKAYTEQPKYM